MSMRCFRCYVREGDRKARKAGESRSIQDSEIEAIADRKSQ
jgi:hypothetical protein